jgi:hypothetical protein
VGSTATSTSQAQSPSSASRRKRCRGLSSDVPDVFVSGSAARLLLSGEFLQRDWRQNASRCTRRWRTACRRRARASLRVTMHAIASERRTSNPRMARTAPQPGQFPEGVRANGVLAW